MPELLDCRGLKCPQPVLKVAIRAHGAEPGTTLEVQADCDTFTADIEKWCADNGRVLVGVVDRGSFAVATLQL